MTVHRGILGRDLDDWMGSVGLKDKISQETVSPDGEKDGLEGNEDRKSISSFRETARTELRRLVR